MRTIRELARHVAKKGRLRVLAEAVSDYEKAFGEITEAELAARERADRRNAIVVRPRRR